VSGTNKEIFVKKLTELKTIKEKHIIISGSGSSVKLYKDEILNYIDVTDAEIFGINYMTHLCVPDYHFWTNKQRYRDLGDCVNVESTLLFGCGMPEKLIRKHYDGDYFVVDYVDENGYDFDYKDRTIYGCFRTAGTLSIMVVFLLGAKKISIVGMDGYTLYSREELNKGKKSHHCYGKGYTDDASWEKCRKKDKKVYHALRGLYNYGIRFNILTPTKFIDFYNPEILSIKK